MTSLVGTWRLVASSATDAKGQVLPPPFGPLAMGRVVFDANGRMMAVLCDGRPELPAGAERNYSSYCGNYRFDGDRLVTRVDAASDPARLGSDQVREVRFVDGLMILRPPPGNIAGGTEQRELTWERITPA